MDRKLPVLLAWTALFLVLTACNGQPTKDSEEFWVGEYELVVTPGYQNAAEWPEWERIILNSDGSFQQSYGFQDGQTFDFANGTWSYSDGALALENWRDAAGLWQRGAGAELSARLLGEKSTPPLVLLHPDLNVFYTRVTIRD